MQRRSCKATAEFSFTLHQKGPEGTAMVTIARMSHFIRRPYKGILMVVFQDYSVWLHSPSCKGLYRRAQPLLSILIHHL